MTSTNASPATSPSRRSFGLVVVAIGTLALMASNNRPAPSSAQRALRWGASIPAAPRMAQVAEGYDEETAAPEGGSAHELTPEEYAAQYEKEHEKKTSAAATYEKKSKTYSAAAEVQAPTSAKKTTKKYSSGEEDYAAEYKKHVAAFEAADNKEDVLEEELEEAEELIEDLEQDEEKLSIEQIEKEAEEDGVSDTKLKKDEELLEEDASPLGEKLQELIVEEDKEKVVEEIVEEELGIQEFCFDCIWLGTSEISCHDRVGYLKKVYKTTEDAAKLASINNGGKCGMNDPERVVGIWEHSDRGNLLGIKEDGVSAFHGA